MATSGIRKSREVVKMSKSEVNGNGKRSDISRDGVESDDNTDDSNIVVNMLEVSKKIAGEEEEKISSEGNIDGKSSSSEVTTLTRGSGVLIRFTEVTSSMDGDSLGKSRDGAKVTDGDSSVDVMKG